MTTVEIPPGSGNRYRYEYEGGKTQYKGPVGDSPELGEAEFLKGMGTENKEIEEIYKELSPTQKEVLILFGRKGWDVDSDTNFHISRGQHILYPMVTYKVMERKGLMEWRLTGGKIRTMFKEYSYAEYWGGLTEKGMKVSELVQKRDDELVEKVKDKWENPEPSSWLR